MREKSKLRYAAATLTSFVADVSAAVILLTDMALQKYLNERENPIPNEENNFCLSK